MINILLAGCGRYLQGVGVLYQVGTQLKSLGCTRPLIVGGQKAMSVSLPQIDAGLKKENISYIVSYFYGHCTDKSFRFSNNLKIIVVTA